MTTPPATDPLAPLLGRQVELEAAYYAAAIEAGNTPPDTLALARQRGLARHSVRRFLAAYARLYGIDLCALTDGAVALREAYAAYDAGGLGLPVAQAETALWSLLTGQTLSRSMPPREE